MSSKNPAPSDAVIAKLAGIAVKAEDILASEHPTSRAPIGLRTIKNDRRRSMEKILVLLADPEVREYLARVRASLVEDA
ncbi:MAG TPA: hypothetical protein VJP81_02225 [Candidatus Dormibacteraeota bacterium]|nr:hypothetical protein [Candidatus Dormibacteraeota bacterium]